MSEFVKPVHSGCNCRACQEYRQKEILNKVWVVLAKNLELGDMEQCK